MKKDDQATSKIPDGWALVPIEPNWDMRNEGREFLIDGIEKDYEKIAYFLWKTMVDAFGSAPEAEYRRAENAAPNGKLDRGARCSNSQSRPRIFGEGRMKVRLFVEGHTKDGAPVEMSKTFDSESIRLANYDILKSAFDRMYEEVNRHIDKLKDSQK